MEVLYLLLNGNLPNQEQLREIEIQEKQERKLNVEIEEIIKKYAKISTAADVLSVCLSLMKLELHQKRNYYDVVDKQKEINGEIIKILAKVPMVIADICRVRQGKYFSYPVPNSGLTENFLQLSLGISDAETINYVNKVLILAAENGFTASTFIARCVISSGSGVYDAIVAALDSFKGHAHGGASTDVLEMVRMLQSEKDIDNWVKEQFINKKKIPGFGHRLYKNGDPRLDSLMEGFDLLEKYRKNDSKQILEKLKISVKKQKGLLPNPEIIVGPSLSAIGYEDDVIPMVIFMSRVAGIGAHLKEQIIDNKIIRPDSCYTGLYNRNFIPIENR
jgi:citrate synthase